MWNSPNWRVSRCRIPLLLNSGTTKEIKVVVTGTTREAAILIIGDGIIIVNGEEVTMPIGREITIHSAEIRTIDTKIVHIMIAIDTSRIEYFFLFLPRDNDWREQ